ncbi:radial spoke head protein 4 homolog A [Chrysoperla carnea]|uniref:radial spoke head protein 4 homolog A n=1 Tax=Chrysoperla carnea TaxID=189513 RepID=UPI001D05C66D|nr:radial spoke head protein 4 homolog A [Chrysoperla carnea]
MQDEADESSPNDSAMDEEVLGQEPNLDHQFNKAKAFLQKPSLFTGDNLFDHLSDLLNKILSERPQNIIDFFEDYSRKVKECRYRNATDHLRDIYEQTEEVEDSIKLKPLINPLRVVDFEESVEESVEESDDSSHVSVLESFRLLAEAGISIPKCDMYVLELSLRKLYQNEPIKNLRFWGKIFCLEADYYIAEAELSDEGIARLEAEEEEEEEAEEEDEEMALEEEGGEPAPTVPRKKPPLPKLIKIEEKVVPCERFAQGANKKLYYVCHQPGIDPWIKLPDVTPQQISVSRKIMKYFTGNLEHPLESWPPFPGVEKNYLRAQIGRIAAGTSVAPVGLYTYFENEEEEDFNDEDDERIRTEIYLNSNYDKVNVRDLNDGTLSFWVHTALYILPQGRCIWWNPNELKGEENEEDEEGGEEMVEAETGPVLLSPLTNDASLESIPPWTVRLTTALIPEKACAYIRSNLWPGAYTVTADDKCVYMYMGTGHKYTAYNYSPPPLHPVLREYPIGPEILEMQDPSGAQEEAWRIAHEKHPPAEEEHMESEEDDEDDDDILN